METISRNLEDLVAFHVVATEGSFTRAGETLGTSKAMVSKQVKRLETYLKAQLFHRTTRTLSLTENGVALLSYSRKIIDLSDEASQRLRDFNQGTSGVIRISAPVSLGELIFPSLLPTIRAVLPNVILELDVSNENRDFSKDNVDFALRATEVQHPDLIVRNLGRIKDVICASPGFLAKVKVDRDPTKIVRHECIVNSEEDLWNNWTFNSPSGDIRVKVGGQVATNQYLLARLLCLQNVGILRVPLYIVAKDLEQGRLVELYSEYRISTHPLYLVYLRNEYATQKHKVIKDLILKWCNSNQRFFV